MMRINMLVYPCLSMPLTLSFVLSYIVDVLFRYCVFILKFVDV